MTYYSFAFLNSQRGQLVWSVGFDTFRAMGGKGLRGGKGLAVVETWARQALILQIFAHPGGKGLVRPSINKPRTVDCTYFDKICCQQIGCCMLW